MSTISVDVSSSKIPVLQVGYQGENEVTEVLFTISSWIEEYGEGTAQIRVKRPQNSEDESYLISLPISGGVATWTVTSLDTANKGNGKVQLNYLVGTAIKDSVIYPYKVGKSIVGADSPVDPFDSWIERSKAWAIGELLDDEEVPPSDETYRNNSKFYAEQADTSAEEAEAQAVEAKSQADLAKGYAHQFVGAPRAASTAGDMTDHDLIYVFTGTTTSSLTNGHWYYWNGSAWTDGGVYNSTAFTTDTTLSVSGAAADAKVVGDLKEELSDTKGVIGYKRYYGTLPKVYSSWTDLLSNMTLNTHEIYTFNIKLAEAITNDISFQLRYNEENIGTFTLSAGNTTVTYSFNTGNTVYSGCSLRLYTSSSKNVGISCTAYSNTNKITEIEDNLRVISPIVDELPLYCSNYTAVLRNENLAGKYVLLENGDFKISNIGSVCRTYISQCEEGDVFIINAKGSNGSARLWILTQDFESTDTKTSIVAECDTATSNAGLSNYMLVIPAGVSWAIFNIFDNGYITKIKKNIANYNGVIKNHLKYLVYGNSYACDFLSYVPFIMKNMGITSEIYFYCRDGLSLQNLYDRWESTAATDHEIDYGRDSYYSRSMWHIDTRIEGAAWKLLDIMSAKECAELGAFDFITMQQYSAASIDPDSYEPWLSLIINLLKESVNANTPLYWIGVCTRSSADNIQSALSTLEDTVFADYPFEVIAPYGTAIFNARSNTELAQIGDYANHNLWCSDGVHLQDGLPRYIAALGFVEAILRKHFPAKSVMFDKTRPTTSLMTEWNVLERHTPVVGISDDNCLLAQKCAVMANLHPFDVTQIGSLPYEEVASYSNLPQTGTKGILYKTLDTGYTYTWDGSVYVLNESPES